ncbi:two-component response regulator-like APRR3 isoform X1 [Zingiber officinale]|uniref:two-component response regulator-like APRR3 isoform X1 n=1 Tax=Zingiber officinale TaxID=94328 RepID=UPI001C4D0F83|nr:two-component response regulator-like APRR3 isoform X1 [Zingiber officinale]
MDVDAKRTEDGRRPEDLYGAAGDDAGGRRGSAAAGPSSERQVIRWEKFLPRRSLRVLLVEQDDSTRHIVSALLRKCSYHVAAAADGLKAWEVLREKRYHFDLVLTEVEMPSLSGIGLLSRIVAAEECRNIPVIMMSAQDSIGVVLKCMLKGAVDFLVKPVRKNELRNLWQHVWRRHCLINSTNVSDNNAAASNQLSTNIVAGCKTGENCDDDDDVQSSGSNPDVQSRSVKKQMETLPDMVRNISKESNPKKIMENKLSNNDKIYEPTIKLSHSGLEVSLSGAREENNILFNKPIYREEVACVRFQEGKDADSKPNCQPNGMHESSYNVKEFIEPIASSSWKYAALKRVSFTDAPGEASSSSHGRSISELDSSKLLDLTLRRLPQNGYVNPEFRKNHVLNHSNASAFSKYGNKKQFSQEPVSSSLCIKAMEPVDKTQLNGIKPSHFNDKTLSLYSREMQSFDQDKAIEASFHFQLSSGCNKENDGIILSNPIRDCSSASHPNDVADSACHPVQFGLMSMPIPVEAIPYQHFSAGYGTILQPLFYPGTSFHPKTSTSLEKITVQVCADGNSHHDNHLADHSQHLEYLSHEDNYKLHNWRRAQVEAELRDSRDPPLEQVGQSVFSNQDIYKDCGVTGCSKTTEAAVHAATARECGNESGVRNYIEKGLDGDRSQREAALIKFRLKRKDRCFEKKVRYHSRKKLAEQRPRVKGQFVRQRFIDLTTTTEADD